MASLLTERMNAADIAEAFKPNPLKLGNVPNIDKLIKNTESKQKPPPVYITNINNFMSFCKAMVQTIGSDSFVCQNRSTDTKVYITTIKAYLAAVKYLTENGATFHTIQFKEDKAVRVVVRNLNQNTSVQLIKQKIEQKGFKVRAVSNVLAPDTKTALPSPNKIPLPLFYVDLEPTSNVAEIFKITELLNTKVVIEKPYKKKEIIQCKNCQRYGHTRAYCFHPPKCVKCGENHVSTSCTSTMDTPAKCALCMGEHPANYRGCTAHKQLQKFRKAVIQQKKNSQALQALLCRSDSN